MTASWILQAAVFSMLLPLASRKDAISAPATATVTYRPTSENFANPERGFAPPFDPPWPAQVTWAFCEQNPANYTWTAWTDALTAGKLAGYRSQGMSVALVRYHIAAFRSSPLSQAFLDRLTADFAAARAAGFKLVPRFTYNWPNGGPDAPAAAVLGHLGQLQQVLRDNLDVISYVELGFIGCWGEMNNSASGLLGPNLSINASTRSIIDKAFAVVPAERMIAVRYSNYMFQYYGSPASNPVPIAPLTAAEAFTGTQRARWGHHDDCIVCGEWNFGTYTSARNNASEMKAFLNLDNRYVVQGGEPGDPDGNASTVDEDGDGYTKGQYDSCPRVLREFKQMRWSTLNAFYNPGAPLSYDRWKAEGCFDTIARSLGYRLRLTSSTLPKTVAAGAPLQLAFTVVNDGWASPYNQRLLEAVLRNQQTGAVTRLRLPDDPRRWLPDQTAGYDVQVTAAVPAGLAPGTYDVLLSLPDPAATLYERPEYSIRLANAGLWEAATGYNLLQQAVQVTAPTGPGLSLTPASASMTAGSTASFAVDTFAGPAGPAEITLSVGGLPTGVTGDLRPSTVTAGGSATLTLTAGAGVAAGTTAFTVAGASEQGALTPATGSLTVTVVERPPATGAGPFHDGCASGGAGLSFLGLAALRRRRRR